MKVIKERKVKRWTGQERKRGIRKETERKHSEKKGRIRMPKESKGTEMKAKNDKSQVT